MRFTEEMINEDEKRWHARNVVTELRYCGNYMCDRKDMNNTDIRFYAYIMRKAYYMLKEQPEIVRCKDCKHRPKEPNYKTYENGFDIEFSEGSKCPCQCSGNEYYSWYPEDNWYCANGERRDEDG